MDRLSVTLIDVGWGDSIFIEVQDDAGERRFGLIDSNDTSRMRQTYAFTKRYFERLGIDYKNSRPNFDFILLSHAHADHAQGLKSAMQEFGTTHFWYPKSVEWSSFASLLTYAKRSSRVQHHQSIDDTKILPDLGPVTVEVLWPLHGATPEANENNNSVVLALTLGSMTFLLTGDAEKEVWLDAGLAGSIPANTGFFKVPHHGSVNGTFDSAGANRQPVWLNDCPAAAVLGISSHIRPYGHPHAEVVALLNQNRPGAYFRTDEHYHVTFSTDGQNVTVQYSHV